MVDREFQESVAEYIISLPDFVPFIIFLMLKMKKI